jgi:hypothetical protein
MLYQKRSMAQLDLDLPLSQQLVTPVFHGVDDITMGRGYTHWVAQASCFAAQLS